MVGLRFRAVVEVRLVPFLEDGREMAHFHSSGTTAFVMQKLKSLTRRGAMMVIDCFSTLVGTPLMPGELKSSANDIVLSDGGERELLGVIQRILDFSEMPLDESLLHFFLQI